MYPEVNLQVAAAAEFPVANLEGDGHLVVLVQLLVEALALVRLHLDIVRRCERQQAARRCEETEGREQHLFGGRRGCCVWRVGVVGRPQRCVSEMPACPQQIVVRATRDLTHP